MMDNSAKYGDGAGPDEVTQEPTQDLARSVSGCNGAHLGGLAGPYPPIMPSQFNTLAGSGMNKLPFMVSNSYVHVTPPHYILLYLCKSIVMIPLLITSYHCNCEKVLLLSSDVFFPSVFQHRNNRTNRNTMFSVVC